LTPWKSKTPDDSIESSGASFRQILPAYARSAFVYLIESIITPILFSQGFGFLSSPADQVLYKKNDSRPMAGGYLVRDTGYATFA
jgi:hypothetical protein